MRRLRYTRYLYNYTSLQVYVKHAVVGPNAAGPTLYFPVVVRVDVGGPLVHVLCKVLNGALVHCFGNDL